jgi:hypothetical protein
LVQATLLSLSLLTACGKQDPVAPGGGDDSADESDDGSGADDSDGSGAKPKDAGGATTHDAGAKVDGGAKVDAGAAKPTDAATPPKVADAGPKTPTGEGGGGSAPDAAKPTGGSTFPSVSDPLTKGPYTAKTVENTGPSNNYTIYRPTELGKDGVKHPVLTWGNGGSTNPSWYPMLPHLATHGFVVVAANTVPSIGAEEPLGKDMLAGLDWVLAENERAGSDYAGKLDPTRLAPFGYSMGGLATFTIVGDPRWVTTVHISGGNMGDGVQRVDKIHVPAMFLCGENDIAGPQCDTDFKALTTQSVFYATMMGEDHLGILTGEWADRIRGTVTAWMRWKLMDDATFAPKFEGADCALCKDSLYKVQKKNFD